MKTLPEILRDVLTLLIDREYVVIARGQREPLRPTSSAFQIRLRHDVGMSHRSQGFDWGLLEYRCEARSWLGAQWSNWQEHHGWLGGGNFDIQDVLATDWRIVS